MPYNTGRGVEKSMNPSSRTRAWTPSVLILRGLWPHATCRSNITVVDQLQCDWDSDTSSRIWWLRHPRKVNRHHTAIGSIQLSVETANVYWLSSSQPSAFVCRTGEKLKLASLKKETVLTTQPCCLQPQIRISHTYKYKQYTGIT